MIDHLVWIFALSHLTPRPLPKKITLGAKYSLYQFTNKQIEGQRSWEHLVKIRNKIRLELGFESPPPQSWPRRCISPHCALLPFTQNSGLSGYHLVTWKIKIQVNLTSAVFKSVPQTNFNAYEFESDRRGVGKYQMFVWLPGQPCLC